MREGRGVLVTGAANGIGRATAARLTAAGARVCAVDREPADAPPGGHAIEADLAELDGLEELVTRAEAELGPLDALVNVAGVWEPALVEDLSAEALARTLAVNLEAPILLAAAAAREMRERGYGRIVNVTSVHAHHSAREALA
jgi:2,3-dihydro-2,3-dihydroxybenzoate dehydrogenase